MGIKSFRKPEQLGMDTQVLASAVDEYLLQLTPNPFLTGQLIKRLSLSTTSTMIPHSLNVVPQGWFLVRTDANQTVYEASSTPFTTRFIHLVASGDCVVDLWIF